MYNATKKSKATEFEDGREKGGEKRILLPSLGTYIFNAPPDTRTCFHLE